MSDRMTGVRPFLPPLRRTIHILDQDEWWIPNSLPAKRIADMDADHVRNLIAWLERRAGELHFKSGLSMCFGFAENMSESTADALESAMDEQERMDPIDWLNEKPLMRKLRGLVANE